MSLSLVKNASDQGVVDAALEIADKRRNTLLALKVAIRQKNLAEADQLITQLVPDEESNRINKSQYRRASR